MKKSKTIATIEVPIFENHSLYDPLGRAVIAKDRLEKYLDKFHFEPGLRILEKVGNKITKVELIEISLVKNK